MSSELRVGLIGAGMVMQIAHLPAIRQLKGVKIEAIADINYNLSNVIAENHWS
jgi:predicted dehydrogenase